MVIKVFFLSILGARLLCAVAICALRKHQIACVQWLPLLVSILASSCHHIGEFQEMLSMALVFSRGKL